MIELSLYSFYNVQRMVNHRASYARTHGWPLDFAAISMDTVVLRLEVPQPYSSHDAGELKDELNVPHVGCVA